ncbi:ABATE domain-containing protein [Granulicella sp. L60]|uniref:CGNR zinc finger domain-containing protein n=1 Tax=Granulicella sp. L60 TaxID=1641866 RepID=UPI00131EB6D4|nr:CGNR zinc finger domain-containing protein [Granulicella sp. L60]
MKVRVGIMLNEAVKPFEMIAGDVSLDLVNTLDFRFRESGAEELLGSYDDLLRFMTQSGLLSGAEAQGLDGVDAERGQVLEQVKELREALAGVLYAGVGGEEAVAAHVSLLEGYFKQASCRRRLMARGSRLVWSWEEVRGTVAAPLWLLAQAAADLMVSERIGQLRTCSADACRWLFLDTSKNHSRRWCDMKVCGNRMKARRFQARQMTAK